MALLLVVILIIPSLCWQGTIQLQSKGELSCQMCLWLLQSHQTGLLFLHAEKPISDVTAHFCTVFKDVFNSNCW